MSTEYARPPHSILVNYLEVPCGNNEFPCDAKRCAWTTDKSGSKLQCNMCKQKHLIFHQHHIRARDQQQDVLKFGLLPDLDFLQAVLVTYPSSQQDVSPSSVSLSKWTSKILSRLIWSLRDLVMCRKQSGIALGRLCDKCDGKCPVCDSYVRPTTLVRICDECSFGNYQNKCVVCGGEVRCPALISTSTANVW